MAQPVWHTPDAAQGGVQELEARICGEGVMNFDDFLLQLQEMGQKLCTAVWTKGTIAYRCRTCQVNELSAICVSCFQAGDHRFHDYVMYRSEAGGCCDCGDIGSWKQEGFCSMHSQSAADEVTQLPSHVAYAVSSAVRFIVKELIYWVKEIYLLRTREGSQIDYMKDMATVYINWLHKVCSAGSLRDILCSEMTMDISVEIGGCPLKNPLDILLFTLATLPEALMEMETTLFLQMLFNADFKVWFSQRILLYYGDMILPFISLSLSPDDGYNAVDQSLDRVMSQLFNAPEITLTFIKHNHLLECFLSVLSSVMNQCVDKDVGTVNSEHKIIQARIYGRPQGDLKLILSHPEVALYVLTEREDIVQKMLSIWTLLQWMNPYAYNEAVELNAQISWINAVKLEMLTMVIVFQLIGRCFMMYENKQEACQVALMKFAKATLSVLQSHLLQAKSTRGRFTGLSLHIPLHRTFCAIISKLVLMEWGETEKGFLSELQSSLSEAEVLALMEHPLRILVGMSQVRARQRHQNSEDFSRLELVYRGSLWHDQSMDMDILMLQFCAVARENMQQNLFVAMAEQFDLPDMVTAPAYSEGKQTKLALNRISVIQEFMRLILLVVRERRNTGRSEKDILRYDVIQWLCVRDQTFSQLHNAISGFATDDSKLTETLREVAVYISPKLQERGFYQLKQECWEEFDPLFAQFVSSDLEEALERAVSIGKLESFWRLKDPPMARPPFQRLVYLLQTQACFQLIWNVLHHVGILIKQELTATAAEALGVTALQILAMALADVQDNSSKPRKASSAGSGHAGAASVSLSHNISLYIHGTPAVNPDTKDVQWVPGDSSSQTIYTMLLELRKSNDCTRLVDSVAHILSLLSSSDGTNTGSSSSQPPQIADMSMEDERRTLKKQRQEAILKDFAARQKAFVEQHKGDQASSMESASETSATDHGHFEAPVDTECSSTGESKTVPQGSDHSYEPSGCAFCRCPCNGKDSATGWIALVQRYNVPSVMLSRGKVVQDLNEDTVKMLESNGDNLDSLVTVVMVFPGEESLKSTSIDAYPDEHVRCCGHQMHQNCFQRYVDSLLRRHSGRWLYEGNGIIDLSRMEFLCPICRRLANILLPDVNDTMAWKMSQTKHKDEPTTSECGAQLYRLGGGQDMEISVNLCNETAGVDKFWEDFWQENSNLAGVMSVFSSQCLRVRRDFRSDLPEMEDFILCCVLWEVLAGNVVHSEVERRGDLLAQGDEASSSASVSLKGDSNHWLALKQLGRLALLSNTLRTAAGTKNKRSTMLLDWFGFGALSAQRARERGKVHVSDLGHSNLSFSDSNDGRRSVDDSAEDLQSAPSSVEDYEMVDALDAQKLRMIYSEAVQDEVARKKTYSGKLEGSLEEDLLWKFSTIDPGGVLECDPFGLLIKLLVSFTGCPSSEEILAMVHLAYVVASVQASLAFDALQQKHGWSITATAKEKYSQSVCVPFLRRAAILVQILMYGRTTGQATGHDVLQDPSAMRFEFLEKLLRLPNLARINCVSFNGVQFELSWLQQHWRERHTLSTVNPVLLKVPRQINLTKLPEIFQDLMLQRLKARCSNCNGIPNDPAICLVCGKLLCSGVRLRDRISDCFSHADTETCGIGLFLLMQSTQLLLLRNDRVCIAPSLYMDIHGEEDAGLRRGHLLHLSHLRLNEVKRLWVSAAFDYATHILHTSKRNRGRFDG